MKAITKSVRTKIAKCWDNGWCINNIAHICGTDPDTVVSVLRDCGVNDVQ